MLSSSNMLTNAFSISLPTTPGRVYGRVSEKRQEKEEGFADAIILEEEKGQETRRGLSNYIIV